jgi:NitT/TauT family transport system ATP-binding protein/sulfonate transport system ATP-binding protein
LHRRLERPRSRRPHSDCIAIITPRPGRVERVLDVALPRPRERVSPEFLRLRAAILEMLHFTGREE